MLAAIFGSDADLKLCVVNKNSSLKAKQLKKEYTETYLSQYLTNLIHKILFHNKFYFMPLHVSSTFAHQEVKIALHSLWVHHTYRWPSRAPATYRCDNTRGCVMQFWPPDDEHMFSKHVEVWSKTYCETNLCIKLVKYWDKCTEMHGQQNVKTETYV